MTPLLITAASILCSMLLWGLFTGRWSTEARRTRRQIKDQAAIHPLMNIPVPWAFMLVYLIGVGLQFLLPLELPFLDHEWRYRMLGLIPILLGVLSAFSALGLFKRSHTTTVPFETPSTFVTMGPYRFSRNPMYVGLTLIYLGVAVTQARLWPVIILPLLFAYIDGLVIPREEANLLSTFGEGYEQYRSRVRRWL
ncbi:MAG: isoprenylcysteine carboxylmethyltransferase family protein [Gemmatimonadota bacterium]